MQTYWISFRFKKVMKSKDIILVNRLLREVVILKRSNILIRIRSLKTMLMCLQTRTSFKDQVRRHTFRPRSSYRRQGESILIDNVRIRRGLVRQRMRRVGHVSTWINHLMTAWRLHSRKDRETKHSGILSRAFFNILGAGHNSTCKVSTSKVNLNNIMKAQAGVRGQMMTSADTCNHVCRARQELTKIAQPLALNGQAS